MFINSADRWVYLDIPRCGSHSMGAMLTEHFGGALCRRHQWPEIGRVFDRWFLFTLVRNPFDRFLSIWRFVADCRDLPELWRQHLPTDDPESMLVWLDSRPAFVTGPEMPWTRIAASQSVYLDMAKTTPDLILRLETIREDVARLPFYRDGVAFPWENKSRAAAELSGLSVDLIRKLYAADFARFGYSTRPA